MHRGRVALFLSIAGAISASAAMRELDAQQRPRSAIYYPGPDGRWEQLEVGEITGCRLRHDRWLRSDYTIEIQKPTYVDDRAPTCWTGWTTDTPNSVADLLDRARSTAPVTS